MLFSNNGWLDSEFNLSKTPKARCFAMTGKCQNFRKEKTLGENHFDCTSGHGDILSSEVLILFLLDEHRVPGVTGGCLRGNGAIVGDSGGCDNLVSK